MNEMEFSKGKIVLSLKGNDAGTLYCITNLLYNRYVCVIDGKRRKLATPKRKNIKHLIGVGTSAHPAIIRLQRGESVTDREIRGALAAFRDSEQTNMEGNQFV